MSEIEFKLKNPKEFKGIINLDVGIWEEQETKLYLNNILIETRKLSGWKNILIYSFDPANLKENNILRFEFSNAKSPNEKDKRILALALRTIQIE